MSADLLRRAAETLRERAEKATPGPWGTWDRGVGWHITQPELGLDKFDRPALLPEGFRTDLERGEDATYIATMHPGVALALAWWLAEEADESERLGDVANPNVTPAGSNAYRVARAILGLMSYDLFGNVHVAEGVWGIQVGPSVIQTHGQDKCAGQFCCLHNPSDHPLRDAPLNWRQDRGLMERLCPHGIGHPDPDSLDYLERIAPEFYANSAAGVHGCDGCC